MNIGLVGAGRVGKALGLYFKAHGLNVIGYYSKTPSSVAEAARLTGTRPYNTMQALLADACMLFITTPDYALAEVDEKAASLLGKADRKKTFIHTSGAYPAACLKKLSAGGFPVGSMHPLQSFSDPAISARQLESTFFGIEGTTEAVAVIKTILAKTGGKYGEIPPGKKPLYHAGACVVSNYLVTLLANGMRYFEAAGLDKSTLFPAMEPLILGTLKNIKEMGLEGALTGPIVRGDKETVMLHLDQIKESLPSELVLYRFMAVKTVELAENRRITSTQAEQWKTILKGNSKL